MAKRKTEEIDHHPVVKRFGKALRELRQRRGLTQAALAERLGTSEQYLSRLESGKIAPGVDQVAKIADALSATVHELLPVADPPPDARAALISEATRLFTSVTKGAAEVNLALLVQFLALLDQRKSE
jgi:transcriptional regulator with XRE-family HTH domain